MDALEALAERAARKRSGLLRRHTAIIARLHGGSADDWALGAPDKRGVQPWIQLPSGRELTAIAKAARP